MNWASETFSADPVRTVVLPGLLVYGTATLGALLMYLFTSAKGLESTVPKIKQLIPGKTDTFYARLDFLLVVILGPVIGIICFKPDNSLQALAAGWSWASALNVLVQQKTPLSPLDSPRNPASHADPGEQND